jgi:hypothetical protein
MDRMKVLFISPNQRNMSLVSPVVSLFYSVFKENNIMNKLTNLYDNEFGLINKKHLTY